MCGIFSILNNDGHFANNFIMDQFEKGKRRGPEFSKLIDGGIKLKLGFHRLAINGLNDESNQPITIDNVTLICNGEIYNYKELYALMNVKPRSGSDCEVIIHLYKRYGMEHTLQMLDGVFAFVLCDNSFTQPSKLYIARDPYGVRPLYVLKSTNIDNRIYAFASELKCLSKFQTLDNNYFIEHFHPGTYSYYEYVPG